MRTWLFLIIMLLTSYLLPSMVMAEDASAPSCDETVGGMLDAVKNRTRELDRREDDIRKEEERLKTLKSEIERRIDELAEAGKKAEKALQEMKKVRDEGLGGLAKVYENMPSEEAASRIEKLDRDTAVVLLRTMKSKTAAKILSFVEPAAAARLTQEMGKDFIKKGL